MAGVVTYGLGPCSDRAKMAQTVRVTGKACRDLRLSMDGPEPSMVRVLGWVRHGTGPACHGHHNKLKHTKILKKKNKI